MTTVGRPRDASIDEAILLAAWQELSRVGYIALTMTSVAEGAGIQKPALYRRWGTKPLLVIDTLARHLPGLSYVGHGSLSADLSDLLRQLADAWGTTAARSLSPLLADLADDPAALDAFRLQILQPRGAAMRAALAAAAARGEIRADAPLSVIADVLEGPLMHRALFGSGVLDDDLLAGTLASCLALLEP
ncbi:MAG: Transcriptional regulator, TetR family [Frankiales bacterium]|nr:Transcriptional regulator, TetR family [Frankiales bacterium]